MKGLKDEDRDRNSSGGMETDGEELKEEGKNRRKRKKEKRLKK